MKELLKSKRYMVNLGVITWLWMSAFMTAEIIALYSPPKSVTGDGYYADMFAALVDLAGYLASGLLFGQFLIRKKFIFFLSYGAALVGTAGLVVTDNSQISSDQSLNLGFKILAQFGVASAYQGVFLMMDIFPGVFQSSTFGICNAFGLVSQILVLQALPRFLTKVESLYFAMAVMVVSMILSPFLIGSHRLKL